MKSEQLTTYSETDGTNIFPQEETQRNKILCQHCKRTLHNGIRCQGICVADSDY